MDTGNLPRQLALELPEWLLASWRDAAVRAWHDDEARMRLVIEVASRNVQEGGGPFGAAVFCEDSGALVGLGANRVVSSNCSLWHAETVAIAAAHQHLGKLALGEGRYALFSSCEPCCMCLGATLWSGVRRIACAARDEDARAIGFDEGPKPADWRAACEQRGVRVTDDLLRDEARVILQAYAAQGGLVYNG